MTAKNSTPAGAVDGPAAPTFPLVNGRARGYNRAAVDAFLKGARAAFERDDGAVTASDIREASFPLTRGGYDIAAVDAALTRLEEALATRERAGAIDEEGAGAWVGKARGLAQEILDHLLRKRRRRFARTGLLTYGYRVDEVDHACERIVRYLRDGEPLSADTVRGVAFRMQRRGYREEQVDALLDATVEVILAIA